MIGVGRRARVFASTKPTDLRKNFDTLAQLVTEIGSDPLSGDCYLFINARCTRAKMIFWDGNGLCIYQKRLDRGHFAAPWKRSTDGVIPMTMSELALFFEGSQLVFIGALAPDEVEPNRVATKMLTVR